MSYVPFHIHSQHSILDGVATEKEIAERALKLGCPAITLTDHGSCTGLLPFQDECKKVGIKSILGVECYLNDEREECEKNKVRNDHHIVIIAKNDIGWKNLSYIVTEANTNGFYYKPRTTNEIIWDNSEGLIVSSACIQGEIPQLILKGKMKEATDLILDYKDVFGDDFYLEIQFNELSDQTFINEYIYKLSKKHKIPLILGLDAHYATLKDNRVQDVFMMMQTNTKEKEFKPFDTRELYIKSEKAIYKDAKRWGNNFQDSVVSEMLDNSLDLADKCDFEMKFEKFHFPTFSETRDKEIELFEDYAYEGFDKLIELGRIPQHEAEKYEEKLEFELDIIVEKGFAPYFLVLKDIIDYARSQNCFVGVGRGCIGFDSLIKTKNGIKRICDIKIDDYVLNRYGQWSKVNRLLNYNCFEELLDIKTFYGSFNKNITTKDHKYLVLKQSKDFIEENLEWVKAEDIKINDYLVRSIENQNYILGLKEDIKNIKFNIYKDKNRKIIDSNDLNYLQKIRLLYETSGSCCSLIMKDGNHRLRISEKTNKKYGFNDGKYVYQRVKEIINIPKNNHIVYDIEVEGEHSYHLLDCIVHNSVVGSLVSFCLGITQIDPIKHNLYFERFLNPGKVEMPDIDVDFDSNNKHIVEEYIINKYGSENVCKLITLSKLKTKSILQNLARLLDIPDKLDKTIFSLSVSLDNDDNFDTVEQIVLKSEKYSEHQEELLNIVKLGRRLEGRIRHWSVHAAGMVITPKKLYNYMPIQKVKNVLVSSLTEGTLRRDISRLGMVKIDVLGLSNLVIINETLDLIKERHGIDLNGLLDFDLNDKKLFVYIRKGKTEGTFQFESKGIIDLIKASKPNCFDDMVTLNALYRPATLASGTVEQYIENKKNPENNNKNIAEFHPKLKQILKRTHNLLVFQEQMIEVLHYIGGFDLTESDKARKLLVKGLAGDKDLEELKEKFIAGALKNNLTKQQISEIWVVLREFASYSFNAAHSTAYAFIFMQTVYLKYYYYLEYMSCLLNASPNTKDNNKKSNETKFSFYVKVIQKDGYKVLAPHINKSKVKNIPEGNKSIRASFSIVKNVGYKAVEELVSKQPYNDITDLFDGRLDGRKCNKRTLVSLAQSGALDSLFDNRKGLLKFIEDFYSLKNKKLKEQKLNEIDDYLKVKDFSDYEKFLKEFEVLQCYFEKHPFTKWKKEINLYNSKVKKEHSNIYTPSNHNNKCLIAGMVVDFKAIKTSTGKRLGILKLSDEIETLEIILWNEDIQKYKSYLVQGKVLLIKVAKNQKYNNFSLNKTDLSKKPIIELDKFFDLS